MDSIHTDLTEAQIDDAVAAIAKTVGTDDPTTLLRRCVVTIHRQSLMLDRLHDEVSQFWDIKGGEEYDEVDVDCPTNQETP